MKAGNPSGDAPTVPERLPGTRVTTIIACPGVVPLAGSTGAPAGANENRWFDRVGFRRRLRANLAATTLTLILLLAGVWVALEFVRLQKVAACYEAGRRNCTALNLDTQRR